MAYLHVSLNEQPVAVAGSPDIRVLSVGAITTGNGPAQVNISGMAVANRERTFLLWPSLTLKPGDALSVRLLSEGQATPPSSITTAPELPPKEELARLHAQRSATAVPERSSFSHTRAAKRAGFKVVTSSGVSVNAEIGHSDHLQSEVCLRGDGCHVEVHSFSTTAAGDATSHRLLATTIEFDQTVTIYAA
jgi:hypothetical protein